MRTSVVAALMGTVVAFLAFMIFVLQYENEFDKKRKKKIQELKETIQNTKEIDVDAMLQAAGLEEASVEEETIPVEEEEKIPVESEPVNEEVVEEEVPGTCADLNDSRDPTTGACRAQYVENEMGCAIYPGKGTVQGDAID